MSKETKILLVDDSDIMVRHISNLLAKKHIAVIGAKDLGTAVDAFTKEKPTAIIADFVLEGGQSGLEVISAILALGADKYDFLDDGPKKKTLAAVMTQGALAPADARRAEKLGVPVLQKPVYGNEQDFLMTVVVWLKKAGIL
jgi:CheY-like chemotaxis protein